MLEVFVYWHAGVLDLLLYGESHPSEPWPFFSWGTALPEDIDSELRGGTASGGERSRFLFALF
jgi:hypothetical protein